MTSVGAWEPIVVQGGGGAGGEDAGGSAGSGASGAIGGGGTGATGGAAGGSAGGGGSTGGGAPEPTGLYLEAESGELSGDFAIAGDPAASGGEYLVAPPMLVSDDMPGEAQARYDFELAEDGEYIIWGRIYSPDTASNRFWVQVDGGTWYRWRITVGTIWYWDDFHDNLSYNQPLLFELTAGSHTLLIANAAPDTRLDRLYITANGDEPPGNMTKCRPPHSIDLLEPECSQSCGAQAPAGMHSTCECAGRDDVFAAYDCAGGVCCATP